MKKVRLLGLTTNIGIWRYVAESDIHFKENIQLLEDDDSIKFISDTIKSNSEGNLVLHEWVDDERMESILKRLVEHYQSIAKITDIRGKLAIDRSIPINKLAMESALRLFGKFEIEHGPLLHKSQTACVIQVKSYELKNEQEISFRRVLKCMSNVNQV